MTTPIIRGCGDEICAIEQVAMRTHLIGCLQRDLAHWMPHVPSEHAQAAQKDIEERIARLQAEIDIYQSAIDAYRAQFRTELPDQLESMRKHHVV